ncbi:MAG: hypothetical protein ABI624_00500 [Casimicrobiaceae bacterium]
MPDTGLPQPRLARIHAVTYTVPDVQAIEAVYTRWLRYQVVAREVVSVDAAAGWHAAGLAGRPLLTLGPASGEDVQLRFIEHPAAGGWQALKTHGWNVSEIVVQDVDALAASFAGSPLRIIGPVTPLQRFPMIRAMQVLGPCGECLYFTEVGAGSGLALAPAQSFVGSVFIVVAGGPDLSGLFQTYERFANTVDPPVATRVRVISLANELPAETEHRHGLVKLDHGMLIELDQYPAVTTPRARISESLPVGMAMVTFAALGLDAAQPRLLRGAADELIELVDEHG